MNKVLFVLSLIICSCATVPKNLSFDNALEAGTKKIHTDLPQGAKIAILAFKSDNENLSSYIIEEIYDKMINLGVQPMERSFTNAIEMEVGYQLSGQVDDNEIVIIGHQLGAHFVVTGEITFIDEAYRLRIFAIDIEKGRRIASSSLNINRNDKQINHLITTKTATNTKSNLRDNKEALSIAVQNIIKNISKKSVIFVANNITGTSDFTGDFIHDEIMMILADQNFTVTDSRSREESLRKQQELFENNVFDGIGFMVGADLLITGGVFGNGETKRIVLRTVGTETGDIISSSCVLYNRINTEYLNDIDALSQKIIKGINSIQNGSVFIVNNTIGGNYNADFIHDIIENNLVNIRKYKILPSDTDAKYARYNVNIEFRNKIQVRIIDIQQGNTIVVESM